MKLYAYTFLVATEDDEDHVEWSVDKAVEYVYDTPGVVGVFKEDLPLTREIKDKYAEFHNTWIADEGDPDLYIP